MRKVNVQIYFEVFKNSLTFAFSVDFDINKLRRCNNRKSCINSQPKWQKLTALSVQGPLQIILHRFHNRGYRPHTKCRNMESLLVIIWNLRWQKVNLWCFKANIFHFILSFKVKWLYFIPSLIQKASLIDLGTWHKIRKWLIPFFKSVFISTDDLF